jgi:hypothetical protein
MGSEEANSVVVKKLVQMLYEKGPRDVDDLTALLIFLTSKPGMGKSVMREGFFRNLQ